MKKPENFSSPLLYCQHIIRHLSLKIFAIHKKCKDCPINIPKEIEAALLDAENAINDHPSIKVKGKSQGG